MIRRHSLLKFFGLAGLLFAAAGTSRAQDNYEVQVYPGETLDARKTMLEFHSNFTIEGRKTAQDGVLPTHHAFHETIEITHGFNSWFEVGYYNFLSARAGDGCQWVGTHLRPRVSAPEKWHLPVGLSLSTEFGYQRRNFSTDTWTIELRPIVDQKIGRWYWAFNPTFERALVGLNENKGFEFSPNAKISYDVTPKISFGLEYYGGLGPVSGFDPISEQQQQILPAVDLNLSPKWEINFGLGVGVTRGTDHLLFKAIVGYRFDSLFRRAPQSSPSSTP